MRLSIEWQVPLLFLLILVLTVSAGARLVPLLQRLAARQHAYEDAPSTHAAKTGTPTMGGLLFVLALLVVLAFHAWDGVAVDALVMLGLGCALIGFIDDYFAIRSGHNRGLRARTKLIGTGIIGLVFLFWVWHAGVESAMLLFGGYSLSYSVVVWYVLGLLTILATTHAVNLTDGLDGLAAGAILPPLVVLIWIGAQGIRAGQVLGSSAAVVWIDVATAAAVIGFLYYNRYPARLIMGDTGSLALGGILAGSAILLGAQLLLIVIGGVFVAETLSVILQVASFKLTGKRIFRMSPLHHHFELLGWPETKVTQRFWAASALCSLAGAALVLAPSWGSR